MPYASQAKVWLDPASDQLMLAYEHTQGYDSKSTGNRIALELYKDLDTFIKGFGSQYTDRLVINRTLAPVNEGTPSFDKVKFNGQDIHGSEITLRFHFFKENIHDQQAVGTWNENGSGAWKAHELVNVNKAF